MLRYRLKLCWRTSNIASHHEKLRYAVNYAWSFSAEERRATKHLHLRRRLCRQASKIASRHETLHYMLRYRRKRCWRASNTASRHETPHFQQKLCCRTSSIAKHLQFQNIASCCKRIWCKKTCRGRAKFCGRAQTFLASKHLWWHWKIWRCLNCFFRKQQECTRSHPAMFQIIEVLTKPFSRLPKLDLYVAGFRCNIFSIARAGIPPTELSKALRPFYACYRTIVAWKPKIFILENEPGFTQCIRGTRLLLPCDGNWSSWLDFNMWVKWSSMLQIPVPYSLANGFLCWCLAHKCTSKSLSALSIPKRLKRLNLGDITEKNFKQESLLPYGGLKNFHLHIATCIRRTYTPSFAHEQSRDRQHGTSIRH